MNLAPLSPAAAALLTGWLCAQAPVVLMNPTGLAGGDFYGRSVSAAGDVDRDGCGDVIVGAPFDGMGSAWVLSGRTGAVLSELRPSVNSAFGVAVSDAGDVNDDGWPDLIVGAYLDDTFGIDSGSAHVISGQDFSVIHTLHAGSFGAEFGTSVSGAGDVNQDGRDDVIVGAPYDRRFVNGQTLITGSATVFSGLDGSVLFRWFGDGHDDHFGKSVNEAGDVNADGWPDLVVGAPWDDNSFPKAGMARVFSTNPAHSANPVLYSLDGDGLGYELGWAVCSAGDVDGDGRDDLFVGQPEDKVFGDDAGSAVLFSGIDGSRLQTFYGDTPYSYFGFSVAAADVDHDGTNDLIVGEPRNDLVPYGDEGAVHVYSGASYLAASLVFSVFGAAGGDRLGESVGAAGDVNGDGFEDVISGAPWAFGSGSNTGYAIVHCGSPGQGSTQIYGAGCPAASPLTLSYAGTPRLGHPVDVIVGNGPAAPTLGWVVFGFTNGPPYPLDLAALGLPGCTQYQSLDAGVPVAMGSGGGATVSITVPPAFSPCGLVLYNQAVALDSGAPFGLRVSDAGKIVLAR